MSTVLHNFLCGKGLWITLWTMWKSLKHLRFILAIPINSMAFFCIFGRIMRMVMWIAGHYVYVFISLLLAIIIIVSACIPAFAKSEENKAEKPIATLSLCSCIYVWPIAGHTWIYVHNTSKKPIQVGLYSEKIRPQATVTSSISYNKIDTEVLLP